MNKNNVVFRVVYQAKSLEEFRALMDEFPALSNVSAPEPNGAGIAKSSALIGEKGPNEIAHVSVYGGTRLKQTMIDACGLTGTREDMFAQLKSLMDSGAVAKTATGYKMQAGANHNIKAVAIEDDGADTFAS